MSTTDNENIRHAGFTWRELFISKAFDLVMVIAGITIAFQLNNWKVQSDEKSQERFYLQSMKEDLSNDLKEMKRNVLDLRGDLQLISRIRNRIDKGEIPSDSIGIALVAVFGFETFNENQNTYKNLIHANGLSAIRDRATRAQMTEYYNRYESIKRFESVYTQVIFNSFSYFSPYFNLAQSRMLNAAVISKPETGNVLLMISAQLGTGMDAYEDAMDSAETLLTQIENSLRI